jgi:hypothetical protein
LATTIAQKRPRKVEKATVVANHIADMTAPYVQQGKIILKALGLAPKAKYSAQAIKLTQRGRLNLPKKKLRGNTKATKIDTAQGKGILSTIFSDWLILISFLYSASVSAPRLSSSQ